MSIADNLQRLVEQIAVAAAANGREPLSVQLIGASKTRNADAIRAASAAGLRHVGENYWQEAEPKLESLRGAELVWHFIGPLQANKTQPVAQHFDWVHSLDRVRVANRLSQHRDGKDTALNVLLQVNVFDERSKSGATVDDLPALAEHVQQLPNLRLRGLMAMPPLTANSDQQRRQFAAVRNCFETLRARLKGDDFDQLSMGTSDDFAAAIAEGATFIRVGTALFGPRAPRSLRVNQGAVA